MKTAVSIPDPVFNEAELLARRLGISRSRLYARALGAFVASHNPERITEAMNAAVAAAGEGSDPFVREGARKIFERSEW
jgi:metal-responsive CopG/Arc/MetJ family transcriptional regulator